MPTVAERGAPLFEPVLENRRSSLAPGPLRIVAFNAQRGAHFGGILRCFAREPLRSASIILLSEAALATWRGGCQVARELAYALNMSYAYVPESELLGRKGKIISFLGNAILSREPLEDLIAIPLPKVSAPVASLSRSRNRITREGNEVAVLATIRVRGLAMGVCVAHLDNRAAPGGRERQMVALLERLPQDGPAIFGGDLNTTTMELIKPASASIVVREMFLNSRRFRDPYQHEPLFRRLEEAGFETRGANADNRATFTFARIVPPWMRPKLDWLALRGLHPIPFSARVIPARPNFFARRVSDHDFITTDVEI